MLETLLHLSDDSKAESTLYLMIFLASFSVFKMSATADIKTESALI
jgi:hypothetical protein